MRSRHRLQCDLFEERRGPPTLPERQRSALLQLIETLLAETLAGKVSKPSAAARDAREAAHEQDRA